MDFRDIIGQERVIENLQRAIKNKNIAHSYLFQGPESIGKKKLAMVFAKTLLCKERGTVPCGKCSSCIKFDTGNHPDFYIEKPDGKHFKKEQIEKLQRNIRTLPYEGNKKIYILEDIHKMTQEAENSFLKTLEEPPEYAIIIMTVTNSYSLLPTIVSRCQVIELKVTANNEIEKVLIDKYNMSSEKASVIASFSNGLVGKAIRLAESDEFRELREDIVSKVNEIIESEKFRVFSISKFFEDNKDNIEEILDIMLLWFRDLLIIKEISDNKFIINKDKSEILKKQSMELTTSRIYNIINMIMKTKADISANVNYQLAIEVMLLEMQEG